MFIKVKVQTDLLLITYENASGLIMTKLEQ